MQLWTGALSSDGVTDPSEKTTAFRNEISSWTPSKHPQRSLSLLTGRGNLADVNDALGVEKSDHQDFPSELALPGLFVFQRARRFPLVSLFFRLYFITVDPFFVTGHQKFKYSWNRINETKHLPDVTNTYFLLFVTRNPGNKLFTNLAYVPVFMNNQTVKSNHLTYCL